MRIGTWNLAGKGLKAEHLDVFARQSCDVWLLTEIHPDACDQQGRIAGFDCRLSFGKLLRDRHPQYAAAVASRLPMKPLPEPHPASAAVEIAGLTFCSTLLPWRGCKESFWEGKDTAEKVNETLRTLLAAVPRQNLIWGGDWNQNLDGSSESVGSNEGLAAIQQVLQDLGLQVPTKELMHQNGISHSIDHIAVPTSWAVKSRCRIDARNLSDHDAYIVDVEPPKD